MKTIILDGAMMKTRAEAYAHIAEKMEFPDYFGKNLDALWDLLSTYEAAEVVLNNSSEMLNSLGSYGCKMLKCFYDADKASDSFTFTVNE